VPQNDAVAGIALNGRAASIRRAIAISLPAVLFGYLLTLQVATQAQRSEIALRDNAPLVEAAETLQQEQNELKAQLADLRARLDEIQRSSANQSGAAADLSRQIDDLKIMSGLTPVVGEGVVVVLDDPRSHPLARPDPEKPACHSTDITDVINAGWKGGAEAIAVNDERIVGTSSVYCVGSTIMVNGTLMSPPFTIAMIGAQQPLMRIFEDPGELSDIKQRAEAGLGFRVSRQREIRLRSFTGGLGARHAAPR
jgi:uncharacterized protein YlxW (UPF0749 family)